ncbi:FAD-dependent 5-carboxymethylaminomethyl-2-thiouridine(34) oxidoreductase MnmC [Pigmentiphaga aceris]|uniref:tRNA 5-methylaminomethyl-2-thiouridine biosynthesis bifunctional protein MnmC n=1 Tax=Pigmentiphaga aceris TaxID=1940612 RepID=A0A5C0B3E8_9BURK|nr:FAD-dependent 5-carboxymethylaminomethyl-2-thiouridine(34) oxidoreductase MnmC [Pigmentiphaga aceris]QEI08444.1 FAD-dependent 5-carboxymethylaminomethyl-2-thiouridine(34) oxidoreductase MnmC [Pigmentiphaga aceris]
MFQPLVLSVPAFDAAGSPFSPRYGEAYRAAQAGALSSRSLVAGAGLPARWRAREQFTVFDTSFGLGLNFLATWAAWRDDPARSGRLHMVAVEPHPFDRAGLAQMLAGCVPPAWRDLADQLLAHWPPMTPGMHRLDLDQGRVSLTLAVGPPRELVPQLSFRADAYYLDGFSPSVNPEPWADELLRAAARRAAPGAMLATWCQADAVRRTLVTAGFEIEHHPGSDDTQPMMLGRYAPRYVPRNAAPAPPDFAERRAIVIGAGIAGAGVAHALALRGWQVDVIDAGRDDTHAGHVAAALTPLIARDDSPRARLARAGTLRAHARWLAHAPAAAAVLACGTMQQMRSDSQVDEAYATVAALDFPPEWLQAVDGKTASEFAGRPLARGGFWFPRGMRVQPGLLCRGLLDMPGVTRTQASVDRLMRTPADVPGGEVWLALDAAGQTLARAEAVVVAASVDVPGLLARSGLATSSLDGMRAVSGQIARVPAAGIDPRCVVAGEGYLLPAIDGRCVVGSTYVYDADAPRITDSGRDTVLAKLAGLLPGLDLATIDGAALDDWAGWRAVLPTRLPVIGALPSAPGVWLATAYASRGLSWSALAGELIATQLAGEPVPLERSLLATIAPM